jgi:hypothetical protein
MVHASARGLTAGTRANRGRANRRLQPHATRPRRAGAGDVPITSLSNRDEATRRHRAFEIGENDRFRDLIDVLLLRDLEPDLARVAEACRDVFNARGKQPWPPHLTAESSWSTQYRALAVEQDLFRYPRHCRSGSVGADADRRNRRCSPLSLWARRKRRLMRPDPVHDSYIWTSSDGCEHDRRCQAVEAENLDWVCDATNAQRGPTRPRPPGGSSARRRRRPGCRGRRGSGCPRRLDTRSRSV